MQKMVTDVADQMCWRQIVDVGDMMCDKDELRVRDPNLGCSSGWDEIRVRVKFSNGSGCTLGQGYDATRVGV